MSSTYARTSALRAFQDHRPVRESTAAVGHAVRQLYLNAGVTDVFVETGDDSLLRAMDAADGLYGPDTATELGDEHAVTAIPFSTWGNRAPGPMRVWLPRAPR